MKKQVQVENKNELMVVVHAARRGGSVRPTHNQADTS